MHKCIVIEIDNTINILQCYYLDRCEPKIVVVMNRDSADMNVYRIQYVISAAYKNWLTLYLA